MSERENGREKSYSSGRGVGLAAAVIAVGVGVGAALYYFLNKRTENNPEAGISSQNWLREDTQFNLRQEQETRRMQAFRERSWSLEECSICFDVILKDQEVLSLPCTHQFHANCIMPWLEQKQTCPNCRKSVD